MGRYDIGPTIGIDGEKDFRENIKRINASMGALKTEMLDVATQFDENEDSMESYAAKSKVLNKQVELQKEKLQAAAEMLERSTKARGEDDKVTYNWKATVNKATTDLRLMEAALRDNEKAMNKGSQMAASLSDEMKYLDSEMALVNSTYKKGEKSIESYTDQNKVLNKQIDLQRKHLDGLQSDMEALVAEYGDGDARVLDLKGSINKANAELNRMEHELEANEEAMEGFGKQADRSSKMSGRFKTAIGGIAVGVKGIGKATAQAAVTSIKAIGAAAGAAVVGVVALTESTREYRQDMSKFSQNAKDAGNDIGTMTKELSGLAAITGETDSAIEALSNMMAIGFSDNEITSAMEALSGAIIKFPDTLKIESLADGLQETLATGQATGAFAELIERMGGNLDDFNDSLAGATTEAEKHKVALDWLAQSGLTEVSDQYKEANKEMLSAAQAQFELNDSLAELGAVAEPAVATLKGGLAGVLRDIVNILKGDKDATKGFTDSLTSLVGNSIAQINNLMPMVTSGLSALLPALISGIESVLPDVANAAVQLITVLANSLVGALPGIMPVLVTLIVTLVMTLAQLIIDQGPVLIQTGMDALMMLIRGLMDALPLLIQATLLLFGSFLSTFIDALPELIPMAIEIIRLIAMTLIDALPQLIEQAPVIVRALVGSFIDNFPLLVDLAIDIIVALVTTLGANIPMIIQAATEIMLQLVAALITGIGQIKTVVSRLRQEFGDRVREIDWGQLGKDIIMGIASGIKNAAGNLANSVKSAASEALEAAKKKLGIHSPSRVFKEEVGLQIGAGMAEGIRASTKSVHNAITDVNQDMVDGVDINNPWKPGGGTGGSGDSLHVSVPVYLDGKEITKSTSTTQYKRNKSRSRALGVVPG